MTDRRYDARRPRLEVRVLGGNDLNDLVDCQVCGSEEEAAEVVRRWAERGDDVFLVDEGAGDRSGRESAARDTVGTTGDELTIALAPVSARGVE